MKKITILYFLLFISLRGISCTTAVISGKYTKDGKPMIWKLRDTESFKNKLMYFADGKYEYVGLVNTADTLGKMIWGGANSTGFAIMNSASFNVNEGDTTSQKDQEGFFMKIALQQCATLDDFEKLLQNNPKPMGLASHFGVLDAQGGVAFYEVNNYTFTKFDANDPKTAPNGYILRTNFSFTGTKNKGYGYIRYQTAEQLFSTSKVNEQIIMQDFARCFKHSLLKTDFRKQYEKIPQGENFINSGDLITRHGSASNILIKGVKKGQNPKLTTIWTHIGYPNTCVALPTWVTKALPKVLSADKNQYVPLNELSLKLKDECYPIKRSSGYKYLNISKLINFEQTGFVQQIEVIEKQIFEETKKKLKKWEQNEPTTSEITRFYHWLDKKVYLFYQKYD